jgi:hypothetical protein
VESTPTHRSSLLRSLSIEQNQIFNNLSILIENYNNAYLKALFAYLINKEENSITKILVKIYYQLLVSVLNFKFFIKKNLSTIEIFVSKIE